jgi:hypothetical protein
MDAPDYVIDEAQDPPPNRVGLTAVSVGYVILAALVAFLWLVADTVPSPLFDVGLARPVQLVAGVATVLIATAFHVRHRDAWSAHRPLAVGLALSTAAALLIPASTFLVAAGWAAAMFGGSGAIHVGFTVGLVASVLGLLSTGLLWLGISRSRLRVERPRLGRAGLVIWSLAGLQLLNGVLSTSRGLGSGSPDVELIVLRGFAIGALGLLLGTGLTVALISGARSGEQPNRAWWIAGASRLIVLVGTLAFPFLALALGSVIPGVEGYVLLSQMLSLVGAVGLLMAFALGLPSDGKPHTR